MRSLPHSSSSPTHYPLCPLSVNAVPPFHLKHKSPRSPPDPQFSHVFLSPGVGPVVGSALIRRYGSIDVLIQRLVDWRSARSYLSLALSDPSPDNEKKDPVAPHHLHSIRSTVMGPCFGFVLRFNDLSEEDMLVELAHPLVDVRARPDTVSGPPGACKRFPHLILIRWFTVERRRGG